MKILSLLFTLLFFSSSFAQIDNIKALKMTLDDEYKAQATYLQVLSDFGDQRPFSKIVLSEERHIEALLPFFEKYGEKVPLNPYLGNIPSYASFKMACQAGVQAEIDNVELYKELYTMADDEALIKVFNNGIPK